MKIVLISLIALTAQVSMARCLGEAQIIAKVQAVASKSLTGCVVTIDESSIRHYNESYVCPLEVGEVLMSGVQVGLVDGHDCAYEAGQELSGVIVKNQDGTLTLE